MKKIKNLFLILPVFLLIACNHEESKNNNKADTLQAGVSKANYRHLLGSVNWYNRSAEMRACYYQAYNSARLSLLAKLKNVTLKKKKAVVFDIDETLLNNTPFEIKTIETGRGYSKESWMKWTSLARAAALPGALDFVNFAKKAGVEIFYITNRRNDEKEATVKNLDSLGFPYLDGTHMLFRTDESSKEKRRKSISENYEILLLVGDNLADLSDVFEDRNVNYGLGKVDDNKNLFGDKFIILPNPMYGDWEAAVYGNDMMSSDSEKTKFLEKGLKSGY